MGIWLDELEREVRAEALQALRGRSELRQALSQHHGAARDGDGQDSTLLLLDALPRPGVVASPQEAQELLRTGLAQDSREVFALRRGQAGLLLPGPVQADAVKRLLRQINRRLQQASGGRHRLVFGAARATEARLGAAAWLALADLRLQMRLGQLGLPAEPRAAIERRRTGRR